MKNFLPLAVAFWLASAGIASADRDAKYDLLNDWKSIGYLQSVEDSGPMSMGFRVSANPKDVFQNSLLVLPRMGFFIENKNESVEAYGVRTDWKTVPVSGFGSFLSGISGARVRLVLNMLGSGNLTNLQVAADLEVSDGNGWRAESISGLRDNIREIAAVMLLRPIYGNYDQVNNLLANYVKGDQVVPSREEFWQTFHLSGFKPMEAPSSASSTSAPVEQSVAPAVTLQGQMKLREVFTSKSGLTLTCAEDETQKKALIVEFQDLRLMLAPMDVMLATEYALNADKLKAELKPGEAELGKPINSGKTTVQFGAKASTGKPAARLMLVHFSEGSAVKKAELPEEEARALLAALDKAKAFCQGREAIR